MSKFTLSVDNGVTGSVAILGPDGPFFEPVPTKEFLMGKAGKVIKRIDYDQLWDMIAPRINKPALARAYVERPFTGSAMMINTTVLAARAHEVVILLLEQMSIGFETVDSKSWQLPILGAVKGSAELKKASKLRGMALYPSLAAAIRDHGDADSLLMAHHFHHNNP